MNALVEAESVLDNAQRERNRARQSLTVANEEIRALREEINNPV